VVLAATAALAQSAQPGTTPGAPILNSQGLTARRAPGGNKTTDPQSLVAMRERVEDMGSTLSQMRVLLKQMQVKATTSKATDSLTKANLNMWELMVGHLDKELQQMRVTLAARQDLEARRAALYRQADAKAQAEAQAARASQTARFAQAEKNATGTAIPAATGGTTGQSAERNSTAQSAPAQPAAAPATNNSASPK
jgi:peptidoglycan hydrolase CwlO-like protein